MATSIRSVHYELRYIPEGGGSKWVKLCNYQSKDDKVLLSNYEVYRNSKIISKVDVVEVVTTIKSIDVS